MLVGFRDILIISTAFDQLSFKRLLCEGSDYGCGFKYAERSSSDGMAQTLIKKE